MNNNQDMNNYHNAVAIIGIGCRFPGANDYNEFWNNLESGTNSVTEVPSDRWEIDKFYSPNSQDANKTISKWGGYIKDADKFDARFFDISPREAIKMDPQQRLMLELTWSCIEDAGYSPSKLFGRNIGVFTGVFNLDYKELQVMYGEQVEGHTSTGTSTCMIPNRISYFFDFHGPSVPVDTACSASLVAMHQAINSLKENECEMALVGGVSVLCTPTIYISFSKMRMLSPQGKCQTFDAKADGYVRGEGAGVILLKPLAQAIKDKDRIYGVVKGSAVNHGGNARTLTYPNPDAQAKVIRDAYIKADASPDTVSYIEAHGTGTPVGDAIEIKGLQQAFTQLYQEYGLSPSQKPYCGLGTVKTNIGHLESAAGIAGVIKVLLAMKHKKLPKIINHQELNPRIKLEGSPFYIVEKNQDWQPLQTKTGEPLPRRASVSSFGFGGVNAHVVLEEAPALYPIESKVERPRHILTLSGKNEQALMELAQAYEVFLQSQLEANLANICFTANTGRTHFDRRLCLSAESISELCEKLKTFSTGEETTGMVEEKAIDKSSKIALMFTGQGSQYVGMGYELYQTQPTFRQALQRCEEILLPYLDLPLLKVLYPEPGETSPLNETAYTQPALFAIEYALAQLWLSWGIKPQAVMGHSVGEYVAACVAGVFSLEDGLKLIAHRGRLMQALPQNGAMVSILADVNRVKAAIESYGEKVSIAAFNGPESVVISGEKQAMEEIVAQLSAESIKTKQLQVSHAFHSHLMSPMLAEFEQVARQITYNKPQLDIISNLTGEIATQEIETPEYWCQHIRQPVKFAGGMETIVKHGYEVFVECGAKPFLLGMGRQCVDENLGIWLPSLRSGLGDWQQMLESLAQLYVQGIDIDWSKFDRDYERRKVELPTYAFQRERYWLERTDKSPVLQYSSQKFSVEDLPQPAEIRDRLLPLVTKFQPQEELTTQLEALSVNYILNAWQEMGGDFSLGQQFTKSFLMEKLGVISQHQKLLERLLEILGEIGILKQEGEKWEIIALPDIPSPEEHYQMLLAQYPQIQGELTMLQRCGSKLAEVLQGTCNPLYLLFPEGNLTTAAKLYQDALTFSDMNTLMQKVILDFLQHLPQGRKVRILEIGAGTGGTTSYILPHLNPLQTEYVFTDVGALFTVQAQEKFKEYPFVEYQVLDIEQAPEAQGFDLHKYDLILGANVIHATKELNVSLQNIQQLLTSGGMLVLLEGTERRRWIDLIFGLLEGWWRFSDRHLRPDYPLLQPEQWVELLKQNGFKESVTLGSNHENLFPQAVIVAQASEQIIESSSTSENKKVVQKSVVKRQRKNSSVSKAQIINAIPEERQALLETYLLQELTNILQVPANSLNSQHSLASLLDSLMGFELKHLIETNLGIVLPISKFFEVGSIAQLATLLLEKLLFMTLVVSEFTSTATSEEMEEITL